MKQKSITNYPPLAAGSRAEIDAKRRMAEQWEGFVARWERWKRAEGFPRLVEKDNADSQ